MKKTILKILLCLSVVSLSSCRFFNFEDESEKSSTSETTSSESETSSESSSSETISEEESESELPVREVKGYSLKDDSVYHIGDVYKNVVKLTLITTYTNGDVEEQLVTPYALNSLKNKATGEEYTSTNKFEISGDYTGKASYYLKNDDGQKRISNDIAFHVNSGIEDKATLESIEFKEEPNFIVGDIINERLNFDIYLNWKDLGKELIHYSSSLVGYNASLYKADDSSSNVIDKELEKSTSYIFYLTYNGVSLEYRFTTSGGFIRYEAKNLKIVNSDISSTYSISNGDVKVLVIPITLSGSWTNNWSSSKLSDIDKYYFGSTSSLKSYYETASFNQMNVSGMVTAPYVETSSDLTTNKIQSDSYYTRLFTVINNAVNYVETNNPSINWSDYDLNDDGCIDNIHLITNFNTDSYPGDVWGTPLWPHMFATGNSGTVDKPVANTYSISAIDHVESAVTAIHEQGHIFGLQDYYDYSSTGVDYLGGADMQSYNVFDWNSYSKLSVGWISPYVIDGTSNEAEVTLSAASLNGDCLIIPANYNTWNQSAFDEYFLLELFSPYGNNKTDWTFWNNNYANLGDYGVRLYHVDSRLYSDYRNREVDVVDYYTYLGANNSYDYGDYVGYSGWGDYKLLTIIQAGKTNTFGSTSNTRKYLNSSDLFHEGDTFDFNTYKHFLSKKNKTVTKMDNGETFPYKIYFKKMSKDSVTVVVSKS